MNPLRSHLADIFLTLFLAAAAGWLTGGPIGLLTATSLILAYWLIRHLTYIARLRRWLSSPKPRLIPQGRGIWQEIFDTLLQQSKSRKKRKQKIAEALQRFNRAAEAMPNGTIILNNEGRIEWYNQLAAEHFSLSEDDRGGILANLVRQPEFHRFLQLPPDTEKPPVLKISLTDTRLQPLTLQLTLTQIESGSQLLISQDISASEQLNATRSAFVANVSHELRTPLTVINGFLETLADLPDLPAAQQQEFIALMRQEGSRMQELLADLLTLSRLENCHGDNGHERINLSLLCRQIAEATSSLSQEKHRIETEIEEDIMVRGIAQDLYSALSNIAFNAVRYTPEGGSISLVLRRETDSQGMSEAYFALTDTGCGIAPEHIPRLTERFYRVDPARHRGSGGTGLGLAITKHALAEHNAVLHIESTVGQGSTFSTRFAVLTEEE